MSWQIVRSCGGTCAGRSFRFVDSFYKLNSQDLRWYKGILEAVLSQDIVFEQFLGREVFSDSGEPYPMVTFFDPLSPTGQTSGNLYWPYFTPSPWDTEVCVMKGKSIFAGHYSKEDKEWIMVEESCEATTGTSTFIVMGLKYQVKARGNYCIGIYSEDGETQGTFYLVLAGVTYEAPVFKPFLSASDESKKWGEKIIWEGERYSTSTSALEPMKIEITKVKRWSDSPKNHSMLSNICDAFFHLGLDYENLLVLESNITIGDVFHTRGVLRKQPLDPYMPQGAVEPYRSEAAQFDVQPYVIHFITPEEIRLECEVRGDHLFGFVEGADAFALYCPSFYPTIIADLYK